MHSVRQLMRKKAYRTFFFSLVLVFLLPMLAFATAVNWSVASTRQEAATANRLTLEQFVNGIDGQLYTVVRLADSMLVDDKALYFAERDDPMRTLNNISSFQMLKNLTQEVGIMPNAYADISQCYLYLERSGMVISNTITDAEDFYNRKLTGLFESPEAWRAFLHSGGSGFAHQGGVTYKTTLKRGNAPVMTALISLNTGMFDRYRDAFDAQESFSAAIYAARGDLLFQTDSTPVELASLILDSPEGEQVLRTQGEVWRVLWRQSLDTGCIYTLYLPEATFQAPARRLMQMLILAGVALLGLGIMLALRLARRQYRPILALRSFIDQNAKSDPAAHGDDFEYLSAMIQAMDAEKRSATMEVRLSQQQLEQFAIERLLKGMYSDVAAMEEQLLALNLAFATDCYLVLGVRINGFAEGGQDLHVDDRQLMRFVVSNVMEELLEAFDAHSTVVDGVVWILCALPEDDWDEPLQAALRQGLRFLEERFRFRLTIVAGEPVAGLEGIQRGYRTAIQMLRRAEQAPTALTLQYQESAAVRAGEGSISVNGTAQRLAQCLNEGDEAGLCAALDAFALQSDTLPAHLSRLQWHALLQGVLSSIHLPDNASTAELQRQIDAVISTPLPHDDAASMRELFLFLVRRPRGEDEGDARRSNEIVHRTDNFIQAHYTEVGMNITQIAEYLDLTPSYASALYKRQTGESMLDAINRVRLNHAKQLLLEDVRTAEEIALAVGYYSNSTFLRAFKKYEGVTPGQYRAMASQMRG